MSQTYVAKVFVELDGAADWNFERLKSELAHQVSIDILERVEGVDSIEIDWDTLRQDKEPDSILADILALPQKKLKELFVRMSQEICSCCLRSDCSGHCQNDE